jgi:hypothetical protein
MNTPKLMPSLARAGKAAGRWLRQSALRSLPFAACTSALLTQSTQAADTLIGWGYNDQSEVTNIPQLPVGQAATYLSGALYDGFMVTSDGSGYAWGYNGWGEDNLPTPPAGAQFKQIAGYYPTSLTLFTDGSVVARGCNCWGEGNVPSLPSGVVFTSVAMSWYDGMALTSDGTLVGWGPNWYGELNFPALPAGVKFTSLAGGGYGGIATATDGNAYSWGAGWWGETSVPSLPAGTTYTQVAAGEGHRLALLSDGTVVGWGNNGNGQANVPALPAGIVYTQIAAGGNWSMALRSDGKIVTFGDNGQGQLNVPALATGQVFTKIGAGYYTGYAIKHDVVSVTPNSGSLISILVGSTFADPGATAVDEQGHSLTVTASGSVNSSAVGVYYLTYTATDSLGRIGTATLEVDVVKKLPSDLWIAAMPSYAQSLTYANAALNEPITVWGRAWNGTAPYSFDIDFGDGSAHYTGSNLDANSAKYIAQDHTYTSGGSKTVKVTVSDAAGHTYTRESVIRVLTAPTHNDRVNMAIEKGLINLYRNQQVRDANRVYWYSSPTDLDQPAYTGGPLMAFEENGHIPSHDYEEDIYAETVAHGLNQILDNGNGGIGSIPDHSDGVAVRSSDSNGNGLGAYLTSNTYASAWGALSVIFSQPNAAMAKSTFVKSGPFKGMSYFDLVTDITDQYAWSQGDYGNRGGFEYSINRQDQPRYDGSAQQWPALAVKAAFDRWGIQPQAWFVDNMLYGYSVLQDSGGGVGYSSTGWHNTAKTGGLIVAHSLAGLGVGNTRVDSAISFLGRVWFNGNNTGSDDAGWPGEFYAMYGLKKGLQLAGVTTVSTSNGTRDWYQDESAWLLGNASLLDPNFNTGYRSSGYGFGQNSDGSWNNSGWIGNGPWATAHAILILTKSVTKALPVAVIATPISDQSARHPAPFTLDGSGSYHLDPTIPLVEYLWILDPPATPDWSHPTASGPKPTFNPGWNTPGQHTVILRVADNQDPVNYATATATINVTLSDVPPVAVPIPLAQQPQVYSAKIGDLIQLNGVDSYDVDGDPIVAYAWDLDGNGTYGDAADAALDQSGNGAKAVTASIKFTTEYNGQIGLKVTSQPSPGVLVSSANKTTVDVYASPSDLFISAFTASNVVSGQSADLHIVLKSAANSGKDFNNVKVRIYNGDPFSTGTQQGPDYSVNLPIGGSATLDLTGFAFSFPANTPAVQQQLVVYVDADNKVAEYNESNNTSTAPVGIQPPVAAAQSVTVNTDPGLCSATVAASAFNNGSSDPAGGALSYSVSPAGPYAKGVTSVTLTVTNPFGLTSSAPASVTVVDVEAPKIQTLAPVTVSSDAGVCGAVVTFAAPSASDNCPGVSVVSSPASGSTFPIGTTTVTSTATDASGNTATSTFTVTVSDTEAPVIGKNADISVNTDAGKPTAKVSFTAPAASDNCPGVTVVCTPASGSDFAIGVTTVTCTATDASGNKSSSTFTVTVTDVDAPVVADVPAVTTKIDAGTCGAVVTFTLPSASDNSGSVTVVADPASGSTFPVGTTTVTVTATDASGNKTTTTFTVTVKDTEAPKIGQNADIKVANDAGKCGAVVTYAAPTVSDNCAGVSVVCNPASGSTFPVGTTLVTCTATDAAGNTATSTFNVTVTDSEKPTIGQNANLVVNNDAGKCGAVVTYGLPTASDNCAIATVVNNPASGSVFPIGTTTVVSTATDTAGNSITSSFTVTVKDSEKPTIGQNANIVVGTDAGKCGAVVTYRLPAASDNCAIASVVNNPPSGSTFPVGTTTVTSTATDTAGNTISSSFTVTVKDTEKPTIGTNANIVQGTDPGQCGAVVKYGLPKAADNCGVVSVVNNPPSGSVFPVGVTTVTSTATDAAGNFITSSFTVTVKDTEAPKIVAPADFTIEFTNENGAVATYAAPVVTDNCPGVTYTVSKASGTVFPIGLTTVTITATDKAGNVTTATFTVRVLGANGVKLNVLAEMQAKNVKLKGKWGKDDDDCYGVLSDAIGELTESLKRVNWVDQTHLSCKRGDDAINEERQAVNDLVKLLASKTNPIAPAILQDWINRITACDRLLAVVAINDAVAAKTSASIIAKARAELAAGDSDIASTKGGKYNSGINHYANAWDFATSLTCKDNGNGYEDHDECKGGKDDDRDDDGHRKCGR